MRAMPINPLAHLTVGRGIAFGTVMMVALAFLTGNGGVREEELRVAIVGNSLIYYSDLPRLLEAMSNGKLSQDSCLHGGADFVSHLSYGNGMYAKWATGNARIQNASNADYENAYREYTENSYNNNDDNDDIYDFGACTVRQLLLGADDRFAEEYENNNNNNNNNNNKNRRQQRQRRIEGRQRMQEDRRISHKGKKNEATTATTVTQVEERRYRRLEDAADDYATVDDDSFDENFPLANDGRNPCLMDANYYFFKQSQYDEFNGGVPKWDYILLNDNTRGPCCTSPREEGLEALVDVYVPWILQTGAVPVFMVTHAYWPSTRDMSGLTDIPTFLSLTYEGYREYAEAIGKLLPEHQQPKLAPVGLAFLLIWEENPAFWESLIHADEIHPSPSGTFLEGLVVYATLYGHLPSPGTVLNGDAADLFRNARRMTPAGHVQEAFPTPDQARYLYHIASRITSGEIPKTFLRYTHGESVDFTASKISGSSNNTNSNKNYNNR